MAKFDDELGKKFDEIFGTTDKGSTEKEAVEKLKMNEESMEKITDDLRRLSVPYTVQNPTATTNNGNYQYTDMTKIPTYTGPMTSTIAIDPTTVSSDPYWSARTIKTPSYGYSPMDIAISPNNASIQLSKDQIIIHGMSGKKMVTLDLAKQDVTFEEDVKMDEAAKIFWECLAKSTHGMIAQKEFTALAEETARIANELTKTKELLNKSLRELAKKYTAETKEDTAHVE